MAHLGEDIKKLGFGLMRLPKLGERIDIEQVKTMVDRFMTAGFTYFDTAWAYPGSEDAIRKALVERYPREAFQLATKNAAWIQCTSRDDARKQFETSLAQSGAGYFDFYLLHNLGAGRTRVFDDFNMWAFVQEKKQQGLIRHIGFSAHATAEELEAILSAHPEAEFVQIQINYADWENPAIQARACYEVTRRHGKPVIVMEPVKGGLLANPPEPVAEILRQANPDMSFASWAIRFAASLEGVLTVLSGMSNLEQMDDNLSFMKDFNPLTEDEMKTVDEAQKALAAIPLIPCTVCDYCATVCPENIGISGTFTGMNYLTLYKDKAAALLWEGWHVAGHGKKRASECIKCGECENACPQHIAIRDELDKAVERLGLNEAG
ncbi:aldo/keto reductase [Desulfosarcina sp. OttesenSCG-928-B08]|nr:aldo/keto reductase [Desulfosarcina sp. OttesenSCG-928-B08]